MEDIKIGNEELKIRVMSHKGTFKLVAENPGLGEITETEMESLCDPLPDLTGLCGMILAKIRISCNDMNKAGLIDSVLEGNTSDSVEGGISNRDRVTKAINNMITFGFLKEKEDLNGAIQSNVESGN